MKGIRRFVVLEDLNGGAIFCHGIYDNWYTALGFVMSRIFDEKQEFAGPDDIYEFDPPELSEGESGYVISIKSKKATDAKFFEESWLILFADEEVDMNV